MRTVQRCQEVIRRVAGHLVKEKKRKIMEGEKSNSAFVEKDLLSLLCMLNIDVQDGYSLTDSLLNSEIKSGNRSPSRIPDLRRGHIAQHQHFHVCWF
jgi:hypothetical protein